MEVKAVDRLSPIHEAQLLSYPTLSGCKVGLLINFNVKVLKDGIRRVVNDFPDSPPVCRQAGVLCGLSGKQGGTLTNAEL